MYKNLAEFRYLTTYALLSGMILPFRTIDDLIDIPLDIFFVEPHGASNDFPDGMLTRKLCFHCGFYSNYIYAQYLNPRIPPLYHVLAGCGGIARRDHKPIDLKVSPERTCLISIDSVYSGHTLAEALKYVRHLRYEDERIFVLGRDVRRTSPRWVGSTFEGGSSPVELKHFSAYNELLADFRE